MRALMLGTHVRLLTRMDGGVTDDDWTGDSTMCRSDPPNFFWRWQPRRQRPILPRKPGVRVEAFG